MCLRMQWSSDNIMQVTNEKDLKKWVILILKYNSIAVILFF